MEQRQEKAMMKKTKGRRSIPIQKIQKKSHRNVTFSKRREGLFKKARELSILCGSEIAVIVFSEAGRAFTSGTPCADCVIQRCLNHGSPSNVVTAPLPFDASRNPGGGFEWQNSIERLDSDQLKLYANYLRDMRDTVIAKATAMAFSSGSRSSSAYLTDQRDMDHTTTTQQDHEDSTDNVAAMVDFPVEVGVDSQLVSNWNQVDSYENMLLCDLAAFDGVKQEELFGSTMDVVGDSRELAAFDDVKQGELIDSTMGVVGDNQLVGSCSNWNEADSYKNTLLDNSYDLAEFDYAKQGEMADSPTSFDGDVSYESMLGDATVPNLFSVMQWCKDEDLNFLAASLQD